MTGDPSQPSSVVVAGRLPPAEKQLAQMAGEAGGAVSPSSFVMGVVRDRAVQVVADQGIAQDETEPLVEE